MRGFGTNGLNMELKKIKRDFLHHIRIGDWVEALIHTITLGYGERIALFIAKHIFGSDKCYCCERKQWLNRLTNKWYDGNCNGIKLF